MKPSLTKRVLLHAESRARALAGIQGKISFGPLTIVLPSDHALPRTLKEHPLYDRFLPYLAKRLPAGSTVIDVGANCGDTLAAMLAANQTLRFACVEPNDAFFRYLEENIGRIRRALPDADIQPIQALVGKQVRKAMMKASHGTAHAVASDDAQAKLARTMDEIAQNLALNGISLLKTDVDGFDYDVLDSAEGLIREQAPLVFFECYLENDEQLDGYKKTLHMLQSAGYDRWVIFDNYGELILRTREVEQIEQLFDYCYRLTQGRSKQTVNYFDVLCATEHYSALVDSVAKGYVSEDPRR
jgi:FkbM family methyltransferase